MLSCDVHVNAPSVLCLSTLVAVGYGGCHNASEQAFVSRDIVAAGCALLRELCLQLGHNKPVSVFLNSYIEGSEPKAPAGIPERFHVMVPRNRLLDTCVHAWSCAL